MCLAYEPFLLVSNTFLLSRFASHSDSAAFHKASKHNNSLSTEWYAKKKQVTAQVTLSLYCCGWCPTQFSLSKEIYKAVYFCMLLKQLHEIGPWLQTNVCSADTLSIQANKNYYTVNKPDWQKQVCI